jgi:hypothetical protein
LIFSNRMVTRRDYLFLRYATDCTGGAALSRTTIQAGLDSADTRRRTGARAPSLYSRR